MLTRKQHELLNFIHGSLERTGISPSFDEMKQALGLRSKSGIHRLITALEERGFIRRLPHRARALEIIKLPPGIDEAENLGPNVIRGDFAKGPLAGATLDGASGTASVPLYGRIAAGTPIEALRDPENMVEFPAALLGRGSFYALEVAGDSMVGAGILDGDTVLIERCEAAENGVIVVALVDDEEVTLKRLRRKGNSVALEAANKAFETRIFGPDRVRVQGRMIGLYRRY